MERDRDDDAVDREALTMDVMAPDAGESEQERLTRNWNELLQELRVSQTGVQILFAFLLGVAFTRPFEQTTALQRAFYFVSLLSTACAVGLLIAPVSYHRVLFRHRARPELVRAANRFAIAGLAFIAVAIVSAVALVSDFVLHQPWSAVIVVLLALWLTVWWWIVPLARRRHSAHRSDGRAGPEGG